MYIHRQVCLAIPAPAVVQPCKPLQRVPTLLKPILNTVKVFIAFYDPINLHRAMWKHSRDLLLRSINAAAQGLQMINAALHPGNLLSLNLNKIETILYNGINFRDVFFNPADSGFIPLVA